MFLEVVVSLAIMMVVLLMFFDVLQSLTNDAQRVDGLVSNEETVRFGVDQLQRDVRAATLLDALTVTAAYANQIRFELGSTPSSHQYLRWFYDTTPSSSTYESVLRQVMSAPDASATVLGQAVVIRRVHNIETNTAVFTYFDAQHDDLVSLNPVTPANVANCAIAIHVQLNSDAQPGPQPFSENVDVELRNRLPGGILGCPR